MEVSVYEEALAQIFSRKFKRSPNLDPFRLFLKEYGNPQHGFPSVHIAGTNGKGQVAAKMAYALRSAGYRVGLYTSPHLFRYEERITINGDPIPFDRVLSYDHHLQKVSQTKGQWLNFFECTTLFGFRYFQEEKVDIALVETGIGGRYDPTNVLLPLASVITSIGLDHTEYLGETIAEIARDKGGIIKAETPVIIGPGRGASILRKEAKKKGAPFHLIQETSPFYDGENSTVAKEALLAITAHFSIQKEDVEKGLAYRLPCRFDKRGRVLYDVAHNPDGLKRLCEALSFFYPKKTFRFLVGMSKGKDLISCLEAIEKKAHYVHFVQAKGVDAVEAAELGSIWKKISPISYSLEGSIIQGAASAHALLTEGEQLVVTGSFYIMKEVLKFASLKVE